MSADRPLIEIAGVTKDYPKVATGGDRLRTLAALLFRRDDMPHFRALEAIDLEAIRRSPHGDHVARFGEPRNLRRGMGGQPLQVGQRIELP